MPLNLIDDLGIFKDTQFEAISNYIKSNEGVSKKVYTDTSGNKTIGIGHKVLENDIPGDMEEVFKKDVQEKIDTTKALFPAYDEYPLEVKQSLVDGVFRGEHKKGYKTTKHINKGEWDKVPDEYIDRDDYRASKASETAEEPFTGVYKRMDRNADVFRNYASNKATRPQSASNSGIAGELEDDLGIFKPKEQKNIFQELIKRPMTPEGVAISAFETYAPEPLKKLKQHVLTSVIAPTLEIAELAEQVGVPLAKGEGVMGVDILGKDRSILEFPQAKEILGDMSKIGAKIASAVIPGLQAIQEPIAKGIDALPDKPFEEVGRFGLKLATAAGLRKGAIELAKYDRNVSMDTIYNYWKDRAISKGISPERAETIGKLATNFTARGQMVAPDKLLTKLKFRHAKVLQGEMGGIRKFPKDKALQIVQEVRKMDTNQFMGHIDKRYEAGAPQEELDILETEWDKKVSEEELGITEGVSVEEELVGMYHRYLNPELRRGMETKDILTNMREVILTAGGKQDITDEQLLSAAKDMYEYKQKLIERYKAQTPTGPKAGGKFPQEITPKEKAQLATMKPDSFKITTLDRDVEVKMGDIVKKYRKGEDIYIYQDNRTGKAIVKDGDYGILPKKEVTKVEQAGTEIKGFLSPEEQGIEEVVKGQELQKQYDELMAKSNEAYDKGLHDKANGYRIQAEAIDKKGLTSTKFSSYQDLGGENYQEILFNAPVKRAQSFDEFLKQYRERYPDAKTSDDYVQEIYLQSSAVIPPPKTLLSTQEPGAFRSPHWDEPNVVSHARTSELSTDSKNDTMAVEEIQSDWAKEGRDKGFGNDEIDISKVNLDIVKRGDKYFVTEIGQDRVTDFPQNDTINKPFDSKEQAMDEIRKAFSLKQEGVPYHPLVEKGKWIEFTLKKLVTKAVNEGKKHITWTTGTQQAGRYDLSKQIKKIDWGKNHNGTYDVSAVTKSPEKYVTKRGLTKEEISDFIGKDITEKITKSKDKEGIIEGVDLKIGGEWAKRLYDQQIPQILKKMGGKVTTIDIGKKVYDSKDLEPDVVTGEPMPVIGGKSTIESRIQPAIEITPEMRRKVIGQPMAGGIQHRTYGGLEVKPFTNFETKESPMHLLDKSMNAVNGLRLSGKLTPQEANTQIQEIKKRKLEYAKEKGIAITKTQSGKTRIAIRKSGFYAKKEIATAPINDVYSQFQAPSGMALMQDGYERGKDFGIIYKEVWMPTKKSIAESIDSKNKFDNEFKALLKKYKFPITKKSGLVLSDMLEKKVKIPDRYKDLVEDVRQYMDTKRDLANDVREKMGKSKIGYIENYIPHIQETSIWNELVGNDVTITDNFDFIIPNQVKNPFAYKRLLKEMINPERNFFSLVERYNSAIAKDMYINPAIENIKAYNTVLKDKGLFKASKFWDEYIRTGLLGKQHKIDSALSINPIVRKGLKKWKDILNKAFLTGKISWNIATQPLSYISLTPAETGFKNTLKAVFKMFNKGIRQSVREHSISLKIKSKDILSDAIGEGRGYANRIYRTKIDKWNDMISIISSTEEQLLHQASYIAGLDRAKEFGYTGEDAHMFADLCAERSQSMYNKENRALILNSDISTAAIPFQSFAVELSNHAKEVLTSSKGAMRLTKRQRIGKLIALIVGIWLANQYAKAITGREKTTVGTFIPFAGETVDRLIDKVTKKGYTTTRSPVSMIQQVDDLIKASKNYIKYGDTKKLRRIGITFIPALLGIGGSGQISNLVDGIIANIEKVVRSASGKTLFDIKDLESQIKAPIFGVWATKGGREYWDKRQGKKKKKEETDLVTRMRKKYGSSGKSDLVKRMREKYKS